MSDLVQHSTSASTGDNTKLIVEIGSFTEIQLEEDKEKLIRIHCHSNLALWDILGVLAADETVLAAAITYIIFI